VDYLRQMSFEEDNRTLFHDLITPHRSYAFRARGAIPFLLRSNVHACDASLYLTRVCRGGNRPTSLLRPTGAQKDYNSSRLARGRVCADVKLPNRHARKA
jgi:hypothetical protein